MATSESQSQARQRRRRSANNSAPRPNRHPGVRYQRGGGTEVNCCVKYTIFFFNTFFFMVGFALLGLGVWARVEKDFWYAQLQRTGKMYLDPTIFLIAVGIVTFVIGFLGCVGSLRENTVLLTVYATLLAILLVAEIAVGIYAYVCKEDFVDFVGKIFDEMIISYRDDPDLQAIIDGMQQFGECCGFNTPDDWDKNPYFAEVSNEYSSPEALGVPFSCCKKEILHKEGALENLACGHKSRVKGEKHMVSIFTRGCLEWLRSEFNSKLLYFGIAAIIVCVVQMLGICFAQSLKSDILAQRAKWLNS